MWDMILNLIRLLFFFLDRLIYGFVPIMYKFIMQLAEQEIFTVDQIQAFARNIYALIGLFMIFRLAFVLLKSIVNPDTLTDDKKGFGAIVTRVIVALILIVAIPWGFQMAMYAQGVILENEILVKIFMGGSSSGDDQAAGNILAGATLSSFITCNPSATGCDAVTLRDTLSDPDAFAALDINQKDSNDVYLYNYTFLLSTICGGFVLFMLITFSFDIALRTVKLGFLQLISPVAVVSYVDPSATSGDGFFNKWFKMCKSTYLLLFIRIIALSFMIYVLSLVGGMIDTIADENFFIIVFIILGILMFVKQAPQVIGDLFNMKDMGIGTLNPLKKLGGVPVAGALAGGVAGGVSGAISGRGVAGGLKGFGEGFKAVPFGGGDGKTSVAKSWRTAGDKMTQLRTGDANAKSGIFNRLAKKIDTGLTGSIARSGYNEDVEEKTKIGSKAFGQVYEMVDGNPVKGDDGKFKLQKDKTKYDVYGSDQFRDSLRNMEDSKNIMRSKERASIKAENEYAANPNSANYTALMNANKAKADATKDYESYKDSFDKIKKASPRDAKTYEAFDAYENKMYSKARLQEYRDNRGGGTTPTTNVTPEEVLDFSEKTSNESLKGQYEGGSVRSSGIWVPGSSNNNSGGTPSDQGGTVRPSGIWVPGSSNNNSGTNTGSGQGGGAPKSNGTGGNKPGTK